MLWWKRATDLALVSAALVLLGPLMLLVALLIKLSSRGPVFYVAPRMGWRGIPFGQLKFRTMHVGADRQGAFTAQHDRRVFAVGRWLRLFKIDELPQVLNILRGEMSVVGPRPEEEAVVARYDAHHRRRLKAKPGLTGLQQVEARASSDLDERVRLDVYYLRRRTFLFDLWILMRTPWAVLRGRGAV